MNKQIENVLVKMTKEYGRDMVCAIIAYNFDLGIDSYGMDADEVMACVGLDDLHETNEMLAPEFERMLTEQGEDFVNMALEEYMNDENREYEQMSEQATAPTANTTMVAGSPTASMTTVQQQKTQQAVTPTMSAAPATPVASAPAVQPAPSNNGPSYPNPVKDGFETGFVRWDDLRDCVRDIEATEVVYTHDEDMQACNIGFDPIQPNLHVEVVEDSPIMAGSLAQTMQCSPDAVLSTMRSEDGTGLALKIGKRLVPIGFSAISGMNDCAGLKPNGFYRNWHASSQAAADRYNQQFANGKNGVTIIERSEKIRAMCSARFAYGKYSDILDIFEKFWHGKFPKGTVQNMYLSHSTMRWQLSLAPYKAEIFRGFPELLKSGYNMVLMFATSNTADSAFRIMPAFQLNGGAVVPLCRQEDAVRICHTAKGNFAERVETLMSNILASFDRTEGIMLDASQRMEELKKLIISNPYNTILRVMDECGVAKKQGMEAATNFENSNGNKPVPAFDCFVVIMNAYSFVCRDNPQNQDVQFSASLNVGKAAMLNWAAYDIPGKYTW